MDNKDLLRQYVDTGLRIPEYQIRQLSNNNKKTYLRKRLISQDELYTYEKLMCLDRNVLAGLSIKDVDKIMMDFPHDYYDEMVKNIVETFHISFGDLGSNLFRVYYHYYEETLNKSHLDLSMDILMSEDFIKKMTPYKLGYILGRDYQERLKMINFIFSNKDFKDNQFFLDCMSYLCKSPGSEEIRTTILKYFINNVNSRDIKNVRNYLPDYPASSQAKLITSVILNNKKWLYGLSSENILRILEYHTNNPQVVNMVANELATDDNILKKMSNSSESTSTRMDYFVFLLSKYLVDKDLYEKVKARCEELLKISNNEQ